MSTPVFHQASRTSLLIGNYHKEILIIGAVIVSIIVAVLLYKKLTQTSTNEVELQPLVNLDV